MALLMVAPPAPFIPLTKQGKPVVAIAACYTGNLAEGERVVAAYPTATYARLVALKNHYDPTNLFHLNQNIQPTLLEW
jgi:hypothetical protein